MYNIMRHISVCEALSGLMEKLQTVTLTKLNRASHIDLNFRILKCAELGK
jgi:hypothetical protein